MVVISRLRFASLEADSPRLVLLIAAAGYGKTTTARLLARRWPRSGYCDAGAARNAPEFAEHLLSALNEEEPERSLERAYRTIGGGRDGAMMIETARTAWREARPFKSVLVLDHLERALKVPDIHEFIASLLDRPHPTRSLVLCSREFPALPVSRFAAPHECHMIDGDDLRFTDREIRAILPPNSCEEDVAAVAAVSGGWPIAAFYLAKAAEAGRLGEVVGNLERRGTPLLIEEYFASEVLRDLSQTQLTALTACSIVRDATAADAGFALGVEPAAAVSILDSLPFVTRNDDGSIYTVHPLLRAAIVRRNGSNAESMLRTLARAHRLCGNNVRSAQHALHLGDVASAAEALEATDPYFFGAPSLEIAQVMAAIDARRMQAHPLLWNAATLARVYGISLYQWLDEARVVWRNVASDAPLMLRAGVVGAYANAAGVLGYFEEGRSALEEFERSLTEDEHATGSAVLALWRTAFRVWEGLPADVKGTTRTIAPMLASDALNALWTYNVIAREQRTHGRRRAEAASLAQAMDAAIRSQLPLVVVLVASDLVFHHWLWNDEAAFAISLQRLEELSSPSVFEGVRHFIACARGRGRDEPTGFEKLKLRCAAYLIAAANASGMEQARWFASAAVACSDEARSRFHQILARIARAMLSPSDAGRSADLDEALAFAQETESEALLTAVSAVRRKTGPYGSMSAFVERFAKIGTIEAPILRVFELAVSRNGATIKISNREMEILFALGLNRAGLSRDRLAEWIWPEQPTSSRDTVKVYVNRIRRRLGSDLIVSTAGGYLLSAAVRIDLEEVESALAAIRLQTGPISSRQRETLERAARADIHALVARSLSWSWFVNMAPRVEDAWRDATLVLARDALARDDVRAAMHHGNELLRSDESDNLARDIVVDAMRRMGDDLGAARLDRRLKAASER